MPLQYYGYSKYVTTYRFIAFSKISVRECPCLLHYQLLYFQVISLKNSFISLGSILEIFIFIFLKRPQMITNSIENCSSQ